MQNSHGLYQKRNYKYIIKNLVKNNIIKKGDIKIMEKYVCSVCGYVYDPTEGCEDQGVSAGTPWENVPEDFTCPLCGVGKDLFEKE